MSHQLDLAEPPCPSTCLASAELTAQSFVTEHCLYVTEEEDDSIFGQMTHLLHLVQANFKRIKFRVVVEARVWERALEVFRSGADDCLYKSLCRRELESKLGLTDQQPCA